MQHNVKWKSVFLCHCRTQYRPAQKGMMIIRVTIIKFTPICLIETVYTNAGYI